MGTPGNPALPALSFFYILAFDHSKGAGPVHLAILLLDSPLSEVVSAQPALRPQSSSEVSSETPE
jgi:hypothetical protein